MAKSNCPGIILYFEDLATINDLSDAQLGKLMRALIDYQQTGERKKMQGAVGMAYKFMTNKFDRDQDKYEKICKARSEAAKKRWSKQTESSDAMQLQLLQEDSMQGVHSMQTETETETVTETETETVTETTTITETKTETEVQAEAPVLKVSGGGDGGVTRELLNLMSRYCDLTGERYPLVRENFASLGKQYSEDWLSKALECAARSGNVSIAYIRGILRNWAQAGRPDEREFRDKPHHHDNPALNYSQRSIDLEDLYMDL